MRRYLTAVVGRVLGAGFAAQARGALRESAPTGVPQVHAFGANADRILFVVDAPSVGDGALSHETGLAGHLARQIAGRTGRGADVDILAKGNLSAVETRRELERVDLSRFDAIVLMVGLSEAQSFGRASEWRTTLRSVLSLVTNNSPLGVTTFVVAIPPVRALVNFPRIFAASIDSHAKRLNSVTAEVCGELSRVAMLPFDIPGADRSAPNSSSKFEFWAQFLAPQIARALDLEAGESRVDDVPDEDDRQDSLDLLRVVESIPDAVIDQIVATTHNLFGTTAAAVTFLDRNRRWVKSAIGTSSMDSARIGSFCDATIQRSEIFVINDVELHPEFLGHAGTAVEGIRFYAGFPLEATGGRRVGALCIMDTKPRVFTAQDGALLRELGLQVQTQLWAVGASLEGSSDS